MISNSMPDAIRQAILYQLNNVHTAMPGAVISYDFATQKASVQPLLNKFWSDGTSSPLPVLENVPIIFPRAGGASLTFPVVEGDSCLLLFSERSIDEWVNTGGQVSTKDSRKFDLSDAVAIMGLSPFSSPSLAENNTDLLLTYAGSKIRIRQTGAVEIETSTTIALGTNTIELLDTLITLFTAYVAAGSFALAKPAFTTAATNLTLIKGTIPP